MFDKHWRRSFGLFNNPKLKTLAKNEVNPELRRWLQHDLKEERINKQRRLDYPSYLEKSSEGCGIVADGQHWHSPTIRNKHKIEQTRKV